MKWTPLLCEQYRNLSLLSDVLLHSVSESIVHFFQYLRFQLFVELMLARCT